MSDDKKEKKVHAGHEHKTHSNSELHSEIDSSSFYPAFHKYLPYAIILIITIIALAMVAPIFKPGIPMNIDLPGKYERVWCYQEFRQETGIYSLPTTMCRYKNTGDAVFQSYPPFFYMLIDWISYITGLELAFKIVLVLTYFLPAIGAFLLFYFLKKPLAGSFAYGLLLIELGGWHKGGFEETFNVGMSSNSLASGFFILTIAFLVYFLMEPSGKRFVLMTVSATLMFLSHGLPFVFFALCLVVFAIMFHKRFLEQWRLWLLFPVIFFLLIGFWLVPFLAKSSNFNPGSITHMDWSGIISYFWANLNYLTFAFSLLGIALVVAWCLKLREHSKLRENPHETHDSHETHEKNSGQSWLSSFENKVFLTLFICILVIPLLWFLSMSFLAWYTSFFKLGKYLILIRLHAELRTLLFVFAALFLGYIAAINIKIKKSKVPAGLFVALLLFFFALKLGYPDLKAHSDSLKTSSHPDFQYQWKLFEAVRDAEGRIFIQDTLYNPGTTPGAVLSHSFTAGPVLTGKEFTGTLPWYYYKYGYEFTEENKVLDKYAKDYTPDEIDALMRRMNVEYVIAYHPYFRVAFEHYQKVGALAPYCEKCFPWVVYKTNITPSYFELSNGRILQESYNGLRNTSVVIEVDSGEEISASTRKGDKDAGVLTGNGVLTFKSLYYPNWDVRIDGISVQKIERKDGHMDVIVPSGKHVVAYDYVLLPVDVYSYIFPVVGIIICILLWLNMLPKLNNKAGPGKSVHTYRHKNCVTHHVHKHSSSAESGVDVVKDSAATDTAAPISDARADIEFADDSDKKLQDSG